MSASKRLYAMPERVSQLPICVQRERVTPEPEGNTSDSKTHTKVAEIPFEVVRLTVGQGYLDVGSVCRCASVSVQWKSIACQRTSFGNNVDLSPFGRTLTPSVLKYLSSTRVKMSGLYENRIQRLNLWNCPQISFRDMRQFLSKCQRLRTLKMCHCNMCQGQSSGKKVKY